MKRGGLDMNAKFYLDNPKRLFIRLGRNSFLRLLDDKTYIKMIYKVKFGRDLNVDNPKTFNEKLQWLKLYDRKPIYTAMVDKIEAKKFVAGIIGQEHIIPTLGVWNRFDDIQFDKLPEQFVLKCSHDSGGLFICKNKKMFNAAEAKKVINKCLKQNYYWLSREWPYKNVQPRILAEQYMEDKTLSSSGLVDYKFFCFNGNPKLLYVSRGLDNHPTAEISFYGMDGIEKEYHRNDYKPYHNAIMPSNFDEMKSIAKRIAAEVDSPFVRIDLYSINGGIFFSEITLSPCSGMIPFEPMNADMELGKELHIRTEC